MRAVTAAPVARLAILGAVSLVLVGGAAASRAGTPAPPAPALRPALRPASLAPYGAAARLGPAQALRAAQTCAAYAAAAGWANNGEYGGDLVIAVAVCVAESGGQPSIYYCDGTGTVGYYPPVNCPGGSYDRGLWQINSKYHPEVIDACAFGAQCNADAAYQISDQGTDFAPWAVYDTDAYAQYLGAAQQAVTGLAAGALSAAEFGVCAAPAQPVSGAAVTVGRCGRRTAAQQWTVAGGTVRNGALCLTAGSAGSRPAVTMSSCGGGASQTWAPSGPGQVENGATGRCLHDPGGRRATGTALNLAGCRATRAKTWWLP
jgi:lysozyme-like protein/ricin-type beta-trefoil lectin protein